MSPEADSAAVHGSTGSAKDPQGEELHQLYLFYVLSLYPFMLWAEPPPAPTAGPLKKIFMKEADASNFFRRRSRRGAKSQDEINGEFTLGLFGLRSGQPRCWCVCGNCWHQQRYTRTNLFTIVPWWKSLFCIQTGKNITKPFVFRNNFSSFSETKKSCTLLIACSHFIISGLLLV